MRHGLRFWPLFLVAALAACEDDKPPGGTGGSGGSGGTAQDSGRVDTGTPSPDSGGGGTGGGTADAGEADSVTPPPDGGLVPCLDRPTDLDRPPSGRLPCDLLPPGFVAP